MSSKNSLLKIIDSISEGAACVIVMAREDGSVIFRYGIDASITVNTESVTALAMAVGGKALAKEVEQMPASKAASLISEEILRPRKKGK